MDYFKSINATIPGEMDIDAITTNSQPMLISLGGDTVTWRNLADTFQDHLQLSYGNGFNKIAFHPSGTNFLLGGSQKQVISFSTNKQDQQLLYESMGSINDIKYSPSGRYVVVASEEPKVIVLDRVAHRTMKCRPGHQNKVYNAFFNAKDQYIASIGEDGFVLIYQIFSDKDPQQVFRTKFTQQSVPASIKSCFCQLKHGYRLYIPGTKQIQTVEYLNNRWQLKKTNMGHASTILVAQAVNQHKLVTCCQRDLCIWSIQKQEKITVLEDMALIKVIPVGIVNSFVGHRNDGNIFLYNRPLNVEVEPEMEEEKDAGSEKSQLAFEEEQENIELQYGEDGEPYEEREEVVRVSKKRKADKIVKVLPQDQLHRSTQFYNENRFLFVNLYGAIIQSRQMEESIISVEFNRGDRHMTKTLFKNRPVKYFDMDALHVAYAGENFFGFKGENSWEKDWRDVLAVALSAHWMAVANVSQIRFLDVCGNLLKAVCFDRPVLWMQAYQNLLAVVYHESIPMYESQMLAMKIFTVSQFSVSPLPECPVPLSTVEPDTPGCILKWLGFSEEGMIFSQDSLGFLRAYSLETNEWTPVNLQASIDPKKAWIVGFKGYEAIYWRTTDSDPQPSVRPRLPQKSTPLSVPLLQPPPTPQLHSLPTLLWQRYCLDHQLARYRLWYKLKTSRTQRSPNYNLSLSIKDIQKISVEHQVLDTQMFPIVVYLIGNKEIFKAVGVVKSYFRSVGGVEEMGNQFDRLGFRDQAIQIQYFLDQRKREIEYQTMQELELKELKSRVQHSLKQKKQNPMNPKNKKATPQIPYSLNSQPSQNSSIMQDITQRSQEKQHNDKQREREKEKEKERQKQKEKKEKDSQVEIDNPFLKKKTSTDRKQAIQEQIQKYGVKRKADDKKVKG